MFECKISEKKDTDPSDFIEYKNSDGTELYHYNVHPERKNTQRGVVEYWNCVNAYCDMAVRIALSIAPNNPALAWAMSTAAGAAGLLLCIPQLFI